MQGPRLPSCPVRGGPGCPDSVAWALGRCPRAGGAAGLPQPAPHQGSGHKCRLVARGALVSRPAGPSTELRVTTAHIWAAHPDAARQCPDAHAAVSSKCPFARCCPRVPCPRPLRRRPIWAPSPAQAGASRLPGTPALAWLGSSLAAAAPSWGPLGAGRFHGALLSWHLHLEHLQPPSSSTLTLAWRPHPKGGLNPFTAWCQHGRAEPFSPGIGPLGKGGEQVAYLPPPPRRGPRAPEEAGGAGPA